MSDVTPRRKFRRLRCYTVRAAFVTGHLAPGDDEPQIVHDTRPVAMLVIALQAGKDDTAQLAGGGGPADAGPVWQILN